MSDVEKRGDKSMDAEARLATFFAEDGLADHDLGFSAAVAEAIVRRRLRRDLLVLAGASILAAGLLWILAPVLGSAVGDLVQTFTPALIAGIILASLYAVLTPILRPA